MKKLITLLFLAITFLPLKSQNKIGISFGGYRVVKVSMRDILMIFRCSIEL